MLTFPSELELIGRILLAAVLGGLIGLERDLSGQPAGLRTHIALATGACLFGVLSGYGFDAFDASRSVTNFQVDPTRVASNIVVGVGFLGGGAILKEGVQVRGLTTAASLWVTAAIGLGAALGAYWVTLAATFLVVLSLVGLRGPRRWLARRLGEVRESAVLRVGPGRDPEEVVSALEELHDVRVGYVRVSQRDDGSTIRAELIARRGRDMEAVLGRFADRHEVAAFELTGRSLRETGA